MPLAPMDGVACGLAMPILLDGRDIDRLYEVQIEARLFRSPSVLFFTPSGRRDHQHIAVPTAPAECVERRRNH